MSAHQTEDGKAQSGMNIHWTLVQLGMLEVSQLLKEEKRSLGGLHWWCELLPL